VKLGILVLDTAFERLPGDVGHAATWPFPVQFRVVRGVRPEDAMGAGAPALLDRFVEAANELVDDGAHVITTTCGFLVLLQAGLAARCPVPVVTSSLLQVPWVQMLLPAGRTVGVLASNAHALTSKHLRAARIDAGQPLHVAGFDPSSDFIRHMQEGRPRADAARQETEVLAVVDELLRRQPDVGAIVSECANLPRHSAAIARRFGLPVYDLRGLVLGLCDGFHPASFSEGHDPGKRII